MSRTSFPPVSAMEPWELAQHIEEDHGLDPVEDPEGMHDEILEVHRKAHAGELIYRPGHGHGQVV